MSIQINRRGLLAGGAMTVGLSGCALSPKNMTAAADISSSTMHLVDPEYVEMAESRRAGAITPDMLPAIRESVRSQPILGHQDPVFEAFDVPESVAKFYLYRPKTASATPAPVIIYIHGGGYVVGSAERYHGYCYQLALDSGAVVVSVKYRLAPETPFPGPVTDCYDVLSYVHANAAQLGIDPDRISVMGHSAGGGLTVALTHMARDLGKVPIKAQFPIYPMLDYRTGTTDAPVNNLTTGEFVWGRAANRFGWQSLGGDYAMDNDRKGWFSPTHADSLENLPATFMIVGALDLFLEEDTDYALRLTRAGIPTDFTVYPGAIHGFDALPNTVLTRRFRGDLRLAFERLL